MRESAPDGVLRDASHQQPGLTWVDHREDPRFGLRHPVGGGHRCKLRGMPTNYDSSVREPAEVWRSLRRRRASPPVPPGSSKVRVDTFRSALEQAEQQFRAAASVAYDSRALNLYYGASQAGRAVAAASWSLGHDSWALSGHGLKCPDLSHVGTGVAALTVKSDGTVATSFKRLSQVLGSPLPVRVSLGELWPLMFETTMHAPLGDTQYQPLELYLTGRFGIGAHGVDIAQLLLPPVIRTTPVENRPPLAEFIARYPALRGWRKSTPVGTEIGWPEGDHSLELTWELTEPEKRSQHVAGDRLTRYRGRRMAFPTVAEEAVPLQPLMVWWAVLYVLSMLTRYEPAQWTELIDVNQCEQATAIEFVLDTALAAVPDLLDEAIDLVAEVPSAADVS